MTLNLGQVFKAAVVVGVGHEFGRFLFMTGVRVLRKQFREDVKAQYHHRMHVVRNETPTSGA